MSSKTAKQLKTRRSWVVIIIVLLLAFLSINPGPRADDPLKADNPDVLSQSVEASELALDALNRIEVKGRASKTGYSRDEFGSGWATIGDCDTRNIILMRSMLDVSLDSDDCTVLSGSLTDPYTGKTIAFTRGSSTSSEIQIDHVVALSDAWQKGAQMMDFTERVVFANDPLNLLAVDGPANQQKGDSDAASWLPDNKSFRCRYVARQIAVKVQYRLWITDAEQAAMRRVLNGCSGQKLPVEQYE